MKYDSPLGDARERAWFRRTLGENAKLAGTRCGPSEKEKPMARIRDIYDIIDAVAPFSTALDFDNSGLLVGDGNTQVTRVLLALDITPVVVAEAAAMNANLILSHHPVIFHPLKSLGPQDVPYQLASKGIAALCCHTNLDLSPVCGVNVALGSKLGLRNLRREDVFGEDCVLFSGDLEEPLDPDAFAALVKERLAAPSVKFVPGDRPVKKVIFCSGAGGEYVHQAACRGADAYLTGEMKHHEELEAAYSRMTCVAAGHYHTEKVFAEFLASYLRKRIPDTAFLLSQAEAAPMRSL